MIKILLVFRTKTWEYFYFHDVVMILLYFKLTATHHFFNLDVLFVSQMFTLSRTLDQSLECSAWIMVGAKTSGSININITDL